MKYQPNKTLSQANKDHEGAQAHVPPAMPSEDQTSATHARSHAAHLDVGMGQPNPKPSGNLRRGSRPGERKEP
jgi:hypothetical protein